MTNREAMLLAPHYEDVVRARPGRGEEPVLVEVTHPVVEPKDGGWEIRGRRVDGAGCPPRAHRSPEEAFFVPDDGNWLTKAGSSRLRLQAVAPYEEYLGGGAMRILPGHPKYCPVAERHEPHAFHYPLGDGGHGQYYCDGDGWPFGAGETQAPLPA